LFILLVGIFALNIPAAYASPKSLYLIASHHTREFDAWNIAAPPTGTVSYQFKVTLTYASSPADIAIDESSNTLFITSEGGVTVELVDATTMTLIGTAPGATTNNAGIEMDDANDILYVMRRGSPLLDVYDFDNTTYTLTPQAISPVTLPGCTFPGYGIAFDETTGILWVADGIGVVRAFDVNTWTEITTESFSPSFVPVDIAIDRQRGIVYTVSMTAGAWTPPGSGDHRLSMYDLATDTETLISLVGSEGIGVAVDEDTGFVYVTSRPHNLEVWNPFIPGLIESHILTGPYQPAGICIPQAEVAFNPLSLEKDDGLAGVCVDPGSLITYTISFNNTNPYQVCNVTLWDDLSPDTTFLNATGWWSYDPVAHRVTWTIGCLETGKPGSVMLIVRVNAGAIPGSEIINSATIKPIMMLGGETTVVEKTRVCIGFVIPEVPWGTVMISASMILALLAYITVPRFRRRLI
jgi:uncharacterized repeat protein (TIGR01451 family)